jgi:hypothetical protein
MADAELHRIPEHPLNRGVLAYLARSGRRPVLAAPGEHPDPYLRAGSHPDVVSRVWEELGPAVPDARRCLLHGTPALFLPANGLVLAVALGTEYALRLAPRELRLAIRSGARREHVFATVGSALDLATAFGAAWVFGSWRDEEGGWLAAAVAELVTGA